MKRLTLALLIAAIVAVSGCNSDVVAPPAELAPPSHVTFITGTASIQIAWDASPFASSDKFVGYNVYADTVSIAAVSDTSDAAFLEARLINPAPLLNRSFTVDRLGNGAALVEGMKYYIHVRTVRDDDRLSVASNEIDSAPRPVGDNNEENNDDLLMYDFSFDTVTRSGYGWDRATGDGAAQPTAEVNADKIDFFMVEEANSADDGSEFVSPAQASFTQGWAQSNKSLFKDLGSGDSAWETSIAPSVGDMTEKVKVNADHTYALYTHEGYWVKIRVTRFDKNVAVPKNGGGTVGLNRIAFDYAFQLIDDYGRFKPGAGL